MTGQDHEQEQGDAEPAALDDHADREELRQRYYGLMQELRVVLPGVQVLVAFLVTVPFASRFGELDDVEQALYGVALVSGMLSVVAFVAPTAFHRLGARTARADRLALAIQLTRVGLGFLAVALVASLSVVGHFVFDTILALTFSGVVTVAMVVLWLVIPVSSRREHRPPKASIDG